MSSQTILSKTDDIFKILSDAGKAIMDIYREGDYHTVRKKDNSPVTSADLASDKIISRGIISLFPNVVVLSEEQNIPDYNIRKDWKQFWMLDPLDGTSEFIKKTGEFTINLALIHHTEPVAGYLFIPMTGEMFYAVKGCGSFKYRDNESDKKLSVTTFSLKDKGLKVVASRNYSEPDTMAFINKLDTPQIIKRGSALKFISIATGEADYYPRMIKIMEWDTAAGQIVIEEAGGQLISSHTLKPLTYNKPKMTSEHFIASGHIVST